MCRVLILDDDLRFAESLKPVVDGFEGGGTITEIATTVDRALARAQEALLNGQPYTIFIVDQRLGLGMDGIEAMRELKTISPDSSAIILTGINDTEVGVRAYQAGAFRYLAKPVEEEELTFVLRSLMQSRRVEVENRWRKVFSEMMERALRCNSFTDVADVVIQHCLQLGFERAHLFWSPRRENERRPNVLVGIKRAGEGLFPAFPKTRFNLSEKRNLNRLLSQRDAVFILESKTNAEFKREIESIGCPYPCAGLWILPLHSGDELLGALLLDFGESRKYLTEHHRALLDFLARQISVTLEHSRLYNEQNRTSGEMKLLQHASVQMLRIVELYEESFWLTVLTVATTGYGLGFNRALLFLAKDDGNIFRGEAAIDNGNQTMPDVQKDEKRTYDLDSLIKVAFDQGVHLTQFNASIRTMRIPFDDFGDSIRTAVKQKQVIELSTEEAADQLPAFILNGCHIGACAILPVHVRNALLGMVIVDNQHSSKPLNKIPLDNLQTLLANAGLVWDNHRQRTQSEELLDATYEILGGAGHKPIHETLNLICKTARAFCQADWALIYPLQKITVPPFYEFDFEALGHDGNLTSNTDMTKEQPNLGGVSMHILEKGDLSIEDLDMENPIIGDCPLAEHQFIKREKIKALIGIAIQDPYTREPLGILYLDYFQRHSFNREIKHEIRHANSCARLAAAAISNNRHPTDRHQRGLLDAAQSISKTVGAELNIEEVMASILMELKRLFRDTSLCVLLYDENENALRFAPRTLDYYKIANPEFQNTKFFPLNVMKKGSIACRAARITIETHRADPLHVQNVNEDPDYLPLNPKTVSELCVSLVGRDGNLLGVLALEREKHAFDDDDIAFIRMAVEQLGQSIERAQQSDQLAFKSTVATMTAWASDIAHDINSEIGLIRGHAYLLKQVIKDPQVVRYVDEINESAKKLSSVGPWSEQSKKEISLDKSLQGFLESIVSQRNVKLELNLQAPDAHIKVNPNEFKHVLRHLVRNSARAMGNTIEKKISVSTRHLPDGRAEILFQDYGPGVDDEIRAAIFQRRTTTKTTSGGYGLLIARQLVEDINGKITLLPAEQGKGAVFSIKLPITIKQLALRKTGALSHVA
jgi:GAF domain-containing protein/CheY-like chemotaxis protein